MKNNTTPKPGTGARLRELIREGKTNAAALAVIKKEFPKASTGLNDVSWNRSMLRTGKFGSAKEVITNAQAEAKAKK